MRCDVSENNIFVIFAALLCMKNNILCSFGISRISFSRFQPAPNHLHNIWSHDFFVLNPLLTRIPATWSAKCRSHESIIKSPPVRVNSIHWPFNQHGYVIFCSVNVCCCRFIKWKQRKSHVFSGRFWFTGVWVTMRKQITYKRLCQKAEYLKKLKHRSKVKIRPILKNFLYLPLGSIYTPTL